MIRRYIFLFSLLILLQGCDLFNREKEQPAGDPVARVYDKYLYDQDLKALNLKGLTAEDSAKLVNDYIENWVRHNLMLEYAQENLPSSKLNIEKQIQEYRESLIIYNYEKEYIAQNLDTIIREQEMEEFYRNNQQNFTLNNDIYRLKYLKLVHDSPQLDSARLWMRSDKLRYEDDLRNYAFQYAIDFNLNDSIWLNARILSNILPSRAMEDHNLKRQEFIQVIDTPYLYLLKVNEFKIKETTAPLSYVMEDIKKIVLNKRKMQLLKEFNSNVYKDAARKKNFQIYN